MRSRDKRARRKRLHRKTTERAKERQALERERATVPWGFRILTSEQILDLDDDQIEVMFARFQALHEPAAKAAEDKRGYLWAHHYATEVLYGRVEVADRFPLTDEGTEALVQAWRSGEVSEADLGEWDLAFLRERAQALAAEAAAG